MTSLERDALVGRLAEALQANTSAVLERLSQPILYLRATHDRIIPRACGERVLALKASTRLVEIEGPHLLLQTRAAAAWLHIRAFVEAIGEREKG